MRRRDESGSSLVIVLALIVFLAVLLPPMLGLAITGSRATAPVKEDRRQLYAANSALEAAVQQGRVADWVGRDLVHGVDCPTQSLDIDGFTITVECESFTQRCDLNRRIVYEALSGGDLVATAEVRFRYGEAPGTEPLVEVVRWAADEPEPLTPPTTQACPNTATTTPPPPTTTTTSTTTTSTSTTTVPSPTLVVAWDSSSTRRTGNTWFADASVTVTEGGVGVAGATIQYSTRTRTGQNNWSSWSAEQTSALADATGAIGLTSGPHGNSTQQVEVRVDSVTVGDDTYTVTGLPVRQIAAP